MDTAEVQVKGRGLLTPRFRRPEPGVEDPRPGGCRHSASWRREMRPGHGWFKTFIPAALLLALLIPLPAAGCSSSTPQGVVRDFIRARLEGNERRAAELTVEGDLTGYLGGEAFLAGSGVSLETETAEVSGDRARVVAHFRWEEGEADISYVCRRVGSRWKVSLGETEEYWFPELELLREEETGN